MDCMAMPILYYESKFGDELVDEYIAAAEKAKKE